jgi:hypothetical protein
LYSSPERVRSFVDRARRQEFLQELHHATAGLFELEPAETGTVDGERGA